MDYQDIIKFHGHSCPGLAIGYRMAAAGMEALKTIRSEDEELVSIVENDACGVDALQCITGCTFGKGNLHFCDYGKPVYILYSRITGRGIRVLFHGKGVPYNLKDDREAYTQWLLNAPSTSIISLKEITLKGPEHARIRHSVLCSACGEPVMETRTKPSPKGLLCLPCAKKD